jgi:hypothetical protein
MGRLYHLYRKEIADKLLQLSPSFDEDAKTRFERINEYLQEVDGPPDLGYIENELGEIRSTIRKLRPEEIVDRLAAKAVFEIQQIEDRHVFRSLAQAALGVDVIQGGRR